MKLGLVADKVEIEEVHTHSGARHIICISNNRVGIGILCFRYVSHGLSSIDRLLLVIRVVVFCSRIRHCVLPVKSILLTLAVFETDTGPFWQVPTVNNLIYSRLVEVDRAHSPLQIFYVIGI